MPTQLPTLAELGGCIFGKGINKNGYSQIYYNGKQRPHHRVIYEQLHGPIEKGMQIDHICHNVAIAHEMCRGEFNCIHRSCINPDHLEAVTPSENQLRGLRGLRNRVKCGNGHILSEVGILTRSRSSGKVGDLCQECQRINNREAQRRFRARKKVQSAN